MNYVLSEQRINQTLRSVVERAHADKVFGRGRNIRGLRRVSQTNEVLPEEIIEEETPVATLAGRIFWKKLSDNDVSLTSSPGQIQIPKQYYNRLPTFVNQEIKPNGASQEESFFDLLFIDSIGNQVPVLNARAIYYTPAPTHPRQNQEIRFTFRNRDVFTLLEARDILVFEDTIITGYSFIVRQIKETDPTYGQNEGRWGSTN